MPSPFIPDGYTRETTIPASAEWDDIHLVYRPMIRSDVIEYTARTKGIDDAGWMAIVDEILSKKIVSWTVSGPDGQTVPVSAASIASLVPSLPPKLWGVVSGNTEPEKDTGDATKN
jgi:hypothetical protein